MQTLAKVKTQPDRWTRRAAADQADRDYRAAVRRRNTPGTPEHKMHAAFTAMTAALQRAVRPLVDLP